MPKLSERRHSPAADSLDRPVQSVLGKMLVHLIIPPRVLRLAARCAIRVRERRIFFLSVNYLTLLDLFLNDG